MAAFKLCNVRRGISRLPFINIEIETDKWPGFYAGDGKWKKLDMKIETREVVTQENCDKILEKLLLENGINIYSSVQLDPIMFSEE
uniref:Uncharacterized protein n=1 Tax=Pithovirus LCPAC403 TaxID=2506596 RepID=A0A481ZC12_9VIRU|nr:MAG: protein of unknown function DUF5060 [Pithovirus LCPAC403]